MPAYRADKNKPSQKIERQNEGYRLDAFMMMAKVVAVTHYRFGAVKMDGRAAEMEE